MKNAKVRIKSYNIPYSQRHIIHEYTKVKSKPELTDEEAKSFIRVLKYAGIVLNTLGIMLGVIIAKRFL